MPYKSEAQRRAMYAAASGHSTLGIPEGVGKDFVEAGPASGKLPERVKGKAVKKGHHETFRRPMNPVMHTKHPDHEEMHAHATAAHLRHDEHPGERSGHPPHYGQDELGQGKGRSSGFEKGGGREHPEGGLSYLQGGSEAALHASPDHFGDREGHDGMFSDKHKTGHHASFRSESKSIDSKMVRSGRMEPKSGYGNPQGGRTTLPGVPPIEGGQHTEPTGNIAPEYIGGKGDRGKTEPHLEDASRGTNALPHSQYSGGKVVPQEVKSKIAQALCYARRR